MLVCLLLFRRYRLCLSVLFFLESVAGGEKEVYLSNLVVAVKWHLSLCVCIPLKVYICVIQKKKSRYMNITLILLYTMDNNKKLGSEFQRFFIFLFFKFSIYKSKIFNNTFFVFIFLLYISKILGILLEISHNIFAYFKICKSLFYLYFFFW